MATPHALPTAATPVERILSRFDRKQIEDFIEVAISLLDAANDPDLEPNGDELDGSGCAEDEFWPHWQRGMAAGCPISDPPEDDDPGGDDAEHGLCVTYGLNQDAAN